MLLVLDDKPLSARNACREVFGPQFPNVHRTLGNLYKAKFNESIGLARKLSQKKRQARREQIEEEGLNLPRAGNPNWVAYLTPDEEKLVCSFLQTCNYMHLPFNRDAFKVSVVLDVVVRLLLLTPNQHIFIRDLSVRLRRQMVATATRLRRTSTCVNSSKGIPSSPSSRIRTSGITARSRQRRRSATQFSTSCRYFVLFVQFTCS